MFRRSSLLWGFSFKLSLNALVVGCVYGLRCSCGVLRELQDMALGHKAQPESERLWRLKSGPQPGGMPLAWLRS